jgi:phosphohistidine phosphatase
MPASEVARNARDAAWPELMLLYLLRHGAAEESGPDVERRLTAQGAASLRAAVPLWRRLNVRPAIVLSSPLPRAVETARILTDGLGLPDGPVPDDRLAPGARWDDLAAAAADHPGAGRIMFVGHDPDLSKAVALLTAAASIRLRKGGMACIEFPGAPEPGTGELAWLLDPDLYRADDG